MPDKSRGGRVADVRARRSSRSRARAFGADLLVVAGAVAGALLLTAGALRELFPAEPAYLVVTMLTAALAAGAGVVAELVTRMTGRWSDARIASALAVYGLVVVPTTTVAPAPDADVIALQTARLVATAGVVALLLLALWPGGLRRSATGWPSVLVIGSIVLVVGVSAVNFPAEAGALLAGVAAGWGLACYAVTGAVLIGAGLLRGHRTTWRIGAGLLVVALAHVLRASASADVSDAYLPFAVLRLTGIAVVLAAITLKATSLRCSERARQEVADAELRAMRQEQQRRREQADERDHEMRNALAGLSGAAQLLGMRDTAEIDDQGELRSALRDELERLRRLLERRGRSDTDSGAPLDTLLGRLILVRGSEDADIELAIPDGLTTPVPSEVLAQVFANLLSNCRRHAPGARVRIGAVRVGATIRVEISDDGPGLGSGTEELVLQRGYGDARAGGQGLGLHVCAELLRAEGATLVMCPSTRSRPGCTAVVELPASVTPPGTKTDLVERGAFGGRRGGALHRTPVTVVPRRPRYPASAGKDGASARKDGASTGKDGA